MRQLRLIKYASSGHVRTTNKIKAKEVPTEFKYEKFSASDRSQRTLVKKKWNSFWKSCPLLMGYAPKNIYYFRALPDKTLTLKGEKCVEGRLSKEWLTILFCANMAGQIEKLLVIGKTA
ncbi:hypothetical protein AMK59_1702 [Oryctes borbonicus]|uniref:Uncharacterized protein n=1 Tax=Oryctes borbonicus TaxID=1629725 RepID=A0A0T6BGR5_9SCAR|nr:hypothetical protein AMK59_1702 [Oryctes borbonicus]